MPSLTNLVFIRALHGQHEELQARLTEIARLTRQEPGCLIYTLHVSSDDPTLFMVYEGWRSLDDFGLHMSAPYMAAIVADMPRLIEGEVKIDPFAEIPLDA